MSTDLQLHQDLLPISSTISLSLNINPPHSFTPMDFLPEPEIEEGCQTPKSPDNKIPEPLTCPPAPKKQRTSAPSSKRRMNEFEFFETIARDEIESFFKASYELVDQNSSTNKRRCITF